MFLSADKVWSPASISLSTTNKVRFWTPCFNTCQSVALDGLKTRKTGQVIRQHQMNMQRAYKHYS